MKDNGKTMAEKIKTFRKSKKITAIELAERLGVSPAYIAKLELGEAVPTKEQVEVIEMFCHDRA